MTTSFSRYSYLALAVAVSAQLPSSHGVTCEETDTANLRTVLIQLTAEDRPPFSAAVQAISERDGETQEKRWELKVPWQGELHLPTSDTWILRALADGYWSPPVAWAGERSEIGFFLRPTAVLSGRLVLPEQTATRAESVSLEFQEISPAGDRSRDRTIDEDELLKGTIECPVSDLSWQCQVPWGRWDLKARVEGYATVYLWDTAVEDGENRVVDPLRLVAGSSLAGWITAEEALPEDKATAQVEIEALKLAVSPDPRTTRRNKLLDTVEESDERGFFQVKGLSPGNYVLRARNGNLRSEKHHVEIARADQDILLEDPLLLLPPFRLDIFLEPQVDPWQQPWLVELAVVEGTYGETVADGQVSRAGHWAQEDMEMGVYHIRVVDSKGSSWLSEQYDIGAETSSLFLEVEVVPVRGRLRWRDEGLEGEVIFGTSNGPRSIRMKSDEDGRFEGALPREGPWRLEISPDGFDGAQAVESVEVRKKPGKSFAQVDLELPGTRLEGRVIVEGKPGRAHVIAVRDLEASDGTVGRIGQMVRPRRRKDFFVQTGEDGKFLLRGIPIGEMRVQAYTRGAASEWAIVDVREDFDHPELVLELSTKIALEGRVVTPTGGVVGAKIISLPSAGLIPDTQSGPGGEFRIELQKNAAFVDLVVLPPSSGLTFQRVPLQGKSRDDLVVSTSTATGDLAILIDPTRLGYLHLYHSGVSAAVTSLMGWFGQESGHMSFRPGAGLIFHGLSPGSWSLCPGKTFQAEHCSAVEVVAGGETSVRLPNERSP